jgi:hypothetical protein
MLKGVFGKDPAPGPVVRQRRLICQACPHKLVEHVCGECYCVIRWKTGVASEACPLGMWGKVPKTLTPSSVKPRQTDSFSPS